jgi:hypothetical protein
VTLIVTGNHRHDGYAGLKSEASAIGIARRKFHPKAAFLREFPGIRAMIFKPALNRNKSLRMFFGRDNALRERIAQMRIESRCATDGFFVARACSPWTVELHHLQALSLKNRVSPHGFSQSTRARLVERGRPQVGSRCHKKGHTVRKRQLWTGETFPSRSHPNEQCKSSQYRRRQSMPQSDLAYAPTPPWHRRRRNRRVLISLLLVTLVICGWRWHQPVLSHAQLLYWQYRCATFVRGADVVVASTGGPPHYTAAPIPPFWTSYVARAVTSRPSLSLNIGKFSPAFIRSVVFIHQLRSPAGNNRIVGVDCIPMYLSSMSIIQAFEADVIEPAPWWPLGTTPFIHLGKFNGGYPIDAKVEVFAGQTDPSDASHFTISYSVNGQPGTLDGWLRDDDTVRLEVRPGSADVYPRKRS